MHILSGNIIGTTGTIMAVSLSASSFNIMVQKIYISCNIPDTAGMYHYEIADFYCGEYMFQRNVDLVLSDAMQNRRPQVFCSD